MVEFDPMQVGSVYMDVMSYTREGAPWLLCKGGTTTLGA
jgi:hypothetical protein